MTQNYLPLLADRLIGRPLMISPGMADFIYSVLEGRINPSAFTGLAPPDPDREPQAPEASRFIGSRSPAANGAMRLNRVHGNTALITVDGALVNRGAWIGANACTGMTSYEGLTALVNEAAADDQIANIVFDINSGGGEATGMFATAAAIRKAAKSKYVIAIVNDTAASAAYGLASAADEIVISPTSVVGSIGIVMMHMDRSAEMAAKGLRPTLIHAGAHKVDGNPFGPLPENVRAAMQRDTLAFYDRFLETVEAGRGKSRLSAKKARETEARVFIGQDAIDAGLADRMASIDDVLAELSRPAKRASTPQRSKAMKPEATNDTPAVTATLNAADHTAIASIVVSQLKAENLTLAPAAAAPSADPVEADRKRAAAVAALPEAQGREALAMQLAAAGMTAEAAKLILAASPIAAAVSAASLLAGGGPEIGANRPEAPKPEAIKAGWAKAFNSNRPR